VASAGGAPASACTDCYFQNRPAVVARRFGLFRGAGDTTFAASDGGIYHGGKGIAIAAAMPSRDRKQSHKE
jgi:hypothetical protein